MRAIFLKILSGMLLLFLLFVPNQLFVPNLIAMVPDTDISHVYDNYDPGTPFATPYQLI
ncbi:MAG: hypothetical protein ABIJ59_01845 [Pseudomonadota bacterium]